ncbi:MAG TPA: hypothetical protein PL033_01170 [Candidatus Brocadiia bacterium]|nr:hypothetical protein [Candidatus Brocadiia bacterium]
MRNAKQRGNILLVSFGLMILLLALAGVVSMMAMIEDKAVRAEGKNATSDRALDATVRRVAEILDRDKFERLVFKAKVDQIANPGGSTWRYTMGKYPPALVVDPPSLSDIPPDALTVKITSSTNPVNDGTFRVTATGTNFFEVTNAAGVAEGPGSTAWVEITDSRRIPYTYSKLARSIWDITNPDYGKPFYHYGKDAGGGLITSLRGAGVPNTSDPFGDAFDNDNENFDSFETEEWLPPENNSLMNTVPNILNSPGASAPDNSMDFRWFARWLRRDPLSPNAVPVPPGIEQRPSGPNGWYNWMATPAEQDNVRWMNQTDPGWQTRFYDDNYWEAPEAVWVDASDACALGDRIQSTENLLVRIAVRIRDISGARLDVNSVGNCSLVADQIDWTDLANPDFMTDSSVNPDESVNSAERPYHASSQGVSVGETEIAALLRARASEVIAAEPEHYLVDDSPNIPNYDDWALAVMLGHDPDYGDADAVALMRDSMTGELTIGRYGTNTRPNGNFYYINESLELKLHIHAPTYASLNDEIINEAAGEIRKVGVDWDGDGVADDDPINTVVANRGDVTHTGWVDLATGVVSTEVRPGYDRRPQLTLPYLRKLALRNPPYGAYDDTFYGLSELIPLAMPFTWQDARNSRLRKLLTPPAPFSFYDIGMSAQSLGLREYMTTLSPETTLAGRMLRYDGLMSTIYGARTSPAHMRDNWYSYMPDSLTLPGDMDAVPTPLPQRMGLETVFQHPTQGDPLAPIGTNEAKELTTGPYSAEFNSNGQPIIHHGLVIRTGRRIEKMLQDLGYYVTVKRAGGKIVADGEAADAAFETNKDLDFMKVARGLLAANLIDYLDSDSDITTYTTEDGYEFHGNEPTPVISEVEAVIQMLPTDCGNHATKCVQGSQYMVILDATGTGMSDTKWYPPINSTSGTNLWPLGNMVTPWNNARWDITSHYWSGWPSGPTVFWPKLWESSDPDLTLAQIEDNSAWQFALKPTTAPPPQMNFSSVGKYIELHNPYDKRIDLRDYEIWIGTKADGNTDANQRARLRILSLGGALPGIRNYEVANDQFYQVDPGDGSALTFSKLPVTLTLNGDHYIKTIGPDLSDGSKIKLAALIAAADDKRFIEPHGFYLITDAPSEEVFTGSHTANNKFYSGILNPTTGLPDVSFSDPKCKFLGGIICLSGLWETDGAGNQSKIEIRLVKIQKDKDDPGAPMKNKSVVVHKVKLGAQGESDIAPTTLVNHTGEWEHISYPTAAAGDPNQDIYSDGTPPDPDEGHCMDTLQLVTDPRQCPLGPEIKFDPELVSTPEVKLYGNDSVTNPPTNWWEENFYGLVALMPSVTERGATIGTLKPGLLPLTVADPVNYPRLYGDNNAPIMTDSLTSQEGFMACYPRTVEPYSSVTEWPDLLPPSMQDRVFEYGSDFADATIKTWFLKKRVPNMAYLSQVHTGVPWGGLNLLGRPAVADKTASGAARYLPAATDVTAYCPNLVDYLMLPGPSPFFDTDSIIGTGEIDNDGDGIANAADNGRQPGDWHGPEIYDSGKININTAPWQVIAAAIPRGPLERYYGSLQWQDENPNTFATGLPAPNDNFPLHFYDASEVPAVRREWRFLRPPAAPAAPDWKTWPWQFKRNPYDTTSFTDITDGKTIGQECLNNVRELMAKQIVLHRNHRIGEKYSGWRDGTPTSITDDTDTKEFSRGPYTSLGDLFERVPYLSDPPCWTPDPGANNTGNDNMPTNWDPTVRPLPVVIPKTMHPRNSFFREEMMAAMANLVTTRSNVFAADIKVQALEKVDEGQISAVGSLNVSPTGAHQDFPTKYFDNLSHLVISDGFQWQKWKAGDYDGCLVRIMTNPPQTRRIIATLPWIDGGSPGNGTGELKAGAPPNVYWLPDGADRFPCLILQPFDPNFDPNDGSDEGTPTGWEPFIAPNVDNWGTQPNEGTRYIIYRPVSEQAASVILDRAQDPVQVIYYKKH